MTGASIGLSILLIFVQGLFTCISHVEIFTGHRIIYGLSILLIFVQGLFTCISHVEIFTAILVTSEE